MTITAVHVRGLCTITVKKYANQPMDPRTYKINHRQSGVNVQSLQIRTYHLSVRFRYVPYKF